MELLAAPTEYLTIFLFTRAQSASISQVYNSINRVQWAASHWFTDRRRDQYRNIKKKESKREIAVDHPGTNRDARYGFFWGPLPTWRRHIVTQKHLDKGAVRSCLTGRQAPTWSTWQVTGWTICLSQQDERAPADKSNRYQSQSRENNRESFQFLTLLSSFHITDANANLRRRRHHCFQTSSGFSGIDIVLCHRRNILCLSPLVRIGLPSGHM